MAENNYYIHMKVLDWWKDVDTNEYYAVVETNGELRLVTRKVYNPHE